MKIIYKDVGRIFKISNLRLYSIHNGLSDRDAVTLEIVADSEDNAIAMANKFFIMYNYPEHKLKCEIINERDIVYGIITDIHKGVDIGLDCKDINDYIIFRNSHNLG